jgi:hypothetical protein
LRKIRGARGVLIRVGHTELVCCIELVINPGIDLFSREVSHRSEYRFGSVNLPPDPSMSGRIQAISDFIIVGRRHLAEQLCEISVESTALRFGSQFVPGWTIASEQSGCVGVFITRPNTVAATDDVENGRVWL